MNFLSLSTLVLLLSVPAAAGPADLAREQLIAALEQMLATGEPHHGAHDDGDVLQRALDRALEQPDLELEQLATRAAASIVATVTRPIVTSDERAPLRIAARVALKLPHRISYTAEVVGSLDGAAPVFLGSVECGQDSFDLSQALPACSRLLGPHHIRLGTRIVFHETRGAADFDEPTPVSAVSA